MTSASKFFAKAAGSMTCADLVHGDGQRNCVEVALWNCTSTFLGCCRYVLPIAVLPIALKLDRLNRSVLRESALMFVEYSLAAWAMNSIGLTSMCILYRLLGRFTFYTVLAVPGTFAASLCSLVASRRLVEMFAHGLFTMAIEVSIARGDAHVLRYVRDAKLWRTLAFMAMNVGLLRAVRQSAGPNMWFLQPVRTQRRPPASEADENANEVVGKMKSMSNRMCCGRSAEMSCADHILNEMFNYMRLGLGVEVLKTVLANFERLKVDPIAVVASLPRRIDCKLTAFLITYCGIYRATNCWLHRRHPQHTDSIQMLAAFVAGIAFYLYPNKQLLAHGLATAIQLSWSNYERQTTSDAERPLIVDWLSRVPIARVFYPLAFGYLLHMRIFYPWLAPNVLMNLMNQTTNFKDNYIMTKYHERLFGGAESDKATLYLFGLLDRLPAQ